jgi:copper chaperone
MKTFHVSGMMCGHCVKQVEEALKLVEGVQKVEVILSEGLVNLDFNENQVSISDLQNALADTSYELS